MKTFLPILSTTAVLAFLSATTLAQDNPAPAATAAEAPAQTEMQKWVETTDAQWQATYKRDVTGVHEADLNRVKVRYMNLVEDGIRKASAANDLNGALALRDEQKRFGDTQLFPEKDEDGDAPAVKAARAAIRVQLAKVEKDHTLRVKALHGKYDQVLAQAQAQLTQSGRLDDALLVKVKREEVKTAWHAGLPATAVATEEQPKAKPPLANAAATRKPEAGNLFTNADFSNRTAGWNTAGGGTVSIDTEERHNGKASLRITNGEATRTMVMQKIPVKPGARYMLNAFIKAKDVTLAMGPLTKKGEKQGAELVVDGPQGGNRRSMPVEHTTGGWHAVTYRFMTNPGETEISTGIALGHYYGPVTGTAWFCDVSLTEVTEKK